MGSYNIPTEEIVEKLQSSIDELEGDYKDGQLVKAIKIIIQRNKKKDKIK